MRIPLDNEVIFRNVGRGQEIGITRNDYSHDLFVDDALEWIEGNRDGPFFLYLSLTIPHANNDAHQLIDQLPDEMAEHRQRLGMEVPDYGPYADEDWAAPLKGTAAMVTRMDTGVGQILDKLEELGIDRDTIVFFTSDNGPANKGGNRPAFFDSNGPFRGLKKGLHEGGLRVPMIVRWPTRVPAGSVSDLVWHFADFLPTAAELAGAELTHSIDGKSIAPDLLGQPSAGSDRFFYWRLESAELAAVRWGKWKAIRNPSERPVQLYDLEEDPEERSDVACRHQGVVTNMREFMDTLDEHANLAPVFASSDRFNLTGNPSVIGNVVAEDDDDAVSGYWVAGGPHKDHFQISDSGVLTFAPDSRFGPYADEADIGCQPFHTLGSNQYGVLVGAASGTGTRRRTSLQPIIVRIADGSEWPLTAGVLGAEPLRHTGQDEVSVRIGFSEAIGTSYSTMRNESFVVTNGTVRNAERVYRRSDLWKIDIAPSSEADIRVVLPPTTDCAAAGAVCTVGGKRLQSRLEVLIPGPSTPEISIAALASPVTEGTAAAFELTLDKAVPAALTAAVSVTESGSALSGTPPVSVLIPQAGTSATLRVPTAGDKVVEPDSTVTATVTAGAGYVAGAASRASVTVEDDDAATFTVTAAAPTIREGESTTLTVAIANGATFAEDQTIALALSGTAAASDFSGVPPTLILPAGASGATATFVAEVDVLEEQAETVTVTASHDEAEIGSATVTIKSISHDATLEDLSLSGVDFGTFSGAVTSYEASVGHGVETVAVTATAGHPLATVTVEPGQEVSLSVGANRIDVTVTAEDGTTTRTYTVIVTRAALPVATITADATPVSEGTAATFTVTLDQPAPEALAIAVSVAETGAVLTGTPPASVAFAKGAASAMLTVPTAADSVVEADSTITVRVTADPGYAVGTEASASVTVEDDDDAIFTVSAAAEAIDEGESTTLTVAISNAVTFSEAQIITLATSGSASVSDYTVVPDALTLAAGASSATARLAAATDDEEEEAETVTVTASHDGAEIGSATVTIHSISRDATLSGLSLSGVDIGTFSGAVTSYEASVAHSVTATTVTATASHSGATVTVEPGPEVGLAVGGNEIAITVTAEDGTTTNTYRVTVTRAALPVATIAAGATPVSEGTAATFTVALDQPAPEALAIAVSVAETGAVLTGTPPASVAFAKGAAGATLTVPTAADSVVEADSTITVTVTADPGYAVGTEASASVTVEDDDAATFTVSAEPATIREGESATLTVGIANGVTFAEQQTLALSTSGTASASDYSGVSAALTLAAGASSASLALAAAEDDEEEEAETLTVTASHGGSEIGSASVTIAANDAPSSDAATLPRIELSSRNRQPRGMWSDGDTLWVSDNLTSTLFAYALTDGARRSQRDVTLQVFGGSHGSTGVWSNGETLWVAYYWGTALLAYRLTDGARDRSRDIPLSDVTPSTMRTSGIWADGETIWVLHQGRRVLEAHRMHDGARRPAQDVPLAADHAVPRGVWGDGETFWVGDWSNRQVYAYRTDGMRDPDADIDIGAAVQPTGLWSDGATLLVAGRSDSLRPYALAARSPNATLTLLQVTGADLGAFSPYATAYAATVAPDQAAATIVAFPASGATVLLDPADAAPEPGHQVSLAVGETLVEAVVTAADGTTQTTYAVTLTRPAAEVPAAQVSAPAGPIAEGATATFAVTLSDAVDAPVTVDVAVAETGAMLAGTQPSSVEIRAGETSAALSIATVQDAEAEADSVVTVSLLAGAGYSLGPEVSAEVSVTDDDAAPLTASFEDLPSQHARSPFTSRVRFSDPIRISFVDFRDHTVAVEHGTVTSATRVGGDSALWEIGVSPASGDDVILTIAAQRPCSERGAVCARDGRRLSVPLSATVAGPGSPGNAVPLTASFEDMPTSHDGETAFAFVLIFSEAPVLSYRTLRDSAFDVDGGTVTRAQRRVTGSNLGWTITVLPETTGALQITLAATPDCTATGAICTGDGRGLSNALSATVRGPDAAPNAVVDGGMMTLTWTTPRDTFAAPDASDFAVRVDGTPRSVTAVALSGGQALLALAEAVRRKQTVVVDYLGSAMHPLANAAGRRARPWTDLAAVNVTGAGHAKAAGLVDAAPESDAPARPVPDVDSLSLAGAGLVDADLAVLSAYGGLRRLDLSGNALTDLSALTNLGTLASLDVSGNALAEIGPLAALTGLRRLDLSGNRIADLAPLSGLPALEVLLLDGNAVTDTWPLTHLGTLQNLGLSENRIADLGPLADLWALRRLDLGDNPAADLSPVGDLEALVWLRLPAADTTSPTYRLTRLRWLLAPEAAGRFLAKPAADDG